MKSSAKAMSETDTNKLAIFGGHPAFSEKLYVGRPNIGNRDRLIQRINQMLDTRWLSNDGPFVAEFEKRVADYIGVKHCVAMCNATIAMEIAVRALGISGEVIIPSFTFIATAHALQWQQITPVFCDIEPATHLLDPRRIEELITPRTAAIVGVHLWGRGCDVEAIGAIAERHRLKVLFDAAHAFGCTHNGRLIGSFGDAEVFSFHATKFFNTSEGGAVTTNNDALAAKIRLMKNFGFSNYDEVSYVGTNGKMTEVSAAMGLTSLEGLEGFVSVNRSNYEHYQKELAGVSGVLLLPYDSTEKCNYQYIVMELDENVAGLTRDQLVQILWAENVIARRYFYPGCHRMEPYATNFPHAGFLLPVTERVADRVITLPTGTAVTANHISTICQVIRFAVSHGHEIQRRLSDAQPALTERATPDAQVAR